MTTDTPNYAVPSSSSSSNQAGRASLVIAVIIVAVGLAQQVVAQSIPLIMADLGTSTDTVGLIFAVFAAVVGLLAIVGLILGIVGLSRERRAAAAAGTAIAASSLLTVAVSFILPLILNAIY